MKETPDSTHAIIPSPPDDVMKGKPALLSGSDSVRLRLVNVAADEVFQLCNHVDQIHSGAPNRCAPNPQLSKPLQIPSHRNLPAPGKLRRTDLLNQYHAVFQGLGCLGPPISKCFSTLFQQRSLGSRYSG